MMTISDLSQRGWRSLSAIALALFAWPGAATAQQSTPSYLRDVAPLLQERCAACHNHTTRKGGLNLESYETLRSGGQRGAAFVPGKSAESLLVKMLEGTLKPQMPPGEPLSAAEIKLIKAWIDAGAPAPTTTNTPTTNLTTGAKSLPELKPTAPVRAAINSLAYRPDGELLALGRYQQAELHNARGLARKLGGHASEVRAVAFSPDGKLLATAGGQPGQFGEIKLWDAATGQELRAWRGHRDNIFALAFSPDGTTLATCSYDKLLKLWDAATGAELRTLKDHTDAVFGLAFSPDGKWLASASADRTVKLWDTASGQRLYTLSDALDAVQAVAFHPSGKLLAGAGADRIIRLWELGATEGKQVRSLIAHEDAIHALVFAPDGKRLASTGADRLIKLWDPATLVETHTFEKQPDWVFALAFAPDGKRLAAGRYDGSLAVYDPLTGKPLLTK
jgi:WD40 repeat protein